MIRPDIENQFKKIVMLIYNAQDCTPHDEKIIELISDYTGLELPTPENYPEGKDLWKTKP